MALKDLGELKSTGLYRLYECPQDYMGLNGTIVTVTFVQATFVLAPFVNIRNISAVTDPILVKLYRKVPLEQIPTVPVTFVQETFVHVTYVYIRNISAVTDPI